jgi:hypothetical protein
MPYPRDINDAVVNDQPTLDPDWRTYRHAGVADPRLANSIG